MNGCSLPADVYALLRKGVVIPAHPLALTADRKLDERRQQALTRYYLAAGSGGVAVGVHTTQFAIRDPHIGLYRPVLRLASETVDRYAAGRTVIKVAGVCGKTDQALSEAGFAALTGYHAVLLSLAALNDASIEELIDHCRAIARIMPVIGFYLQPAVGGRYLGLDFWRRFVEIENVVAVKIAPFNRYATLEVIRAVAESGREDIALYTGNDDNIVNDLLTPFRFNGREMRIVGGLLGHWAVWTRRAVELLGRIHDIIEADMPVPDDLIRAGVEITDCNAAFFDAANGFSGCIPGIHEMLRRQGLLGGRWCLDPDEELSPGQVREIERVCRLYPHLNDDRFVQENIDDFLDV